MDFLAILWEKHSSTITEGAIGIIIITFFTFVLINMIKQASPKGTKLPRWVRVIMPLPVGVAYYILPDMTFTLMPVLQGIILGCVTTSFYDAIAKHLIERVFAQIQRIAGAKEVHNEKS